MKSFIRIAFVSLLALCAASSSRGQGEISKHNGKWWSELEPSRKPDFVSGFLDGTYLGHDFSKWNYMNEAQSGDQKALSALTKAETSFAAYTKKYLDGVTSTKVVEGLDSLYSEKENKKIPITYAVWIVLRRIAHDPEKDTQTLIKNSRSLREPVF